MPKEIHIRQRVAALSLRAAERFNISPEKCHLGHVVLQAMLDNPSMTNQTDGVTGASETNLSVAYRSMKLANAMTNSGLKVGDHVIIMGHNHLDLCVPYYACHYNGYAQCSVDPRMALSEINSLFECVTPKIVFCPKDRLGDIKDALDKNNNGDSQIVVFDEPLNNLDSYITKHKGTDINFRPAEFNQTETTCWLMLTSGTTGLPKVAIVPFKTLLDALCSWWSQITERCKMLMAISTIQWMSSLYFFISSPIMETTRLQSSVAITPELVVHFINTYKPNIAAWSPFLLAQFLRAAGEFVDLQCFKYIGIGGSALEKSLYDQFSAKCSAYLYLVYGMTELLVPVFYFNKDTPFGSAGKEFDRFEYRLVNDDDKENKSTEKGKSGELWIKGDAFFKGYLNNPEETKNLLTDDGWLKTGDIFYKDENDYYYFVERKRLMFKYTGFWVSPLELESVIAKHPGVQDVCVVGIPNKETETSAVAAIVKKEGSEFKPQEIFDLIQSSLPETKHLHGGLFFVDALPETPSGKVHRAKVMDLAISAIKIYKEK